MERIVSIIVGYLIGALLQSGYWIGKMHHMDIREYGSGNLGTTNVSRVLGKKAGKITYLVDCLKAVLAALIVYMIYNGQSKEQLLIYVLYSGLGIVLGHNFPFYLKFKGGKGIAATSGVVLSLLPYNWVLTILGFLTFTGFTFLTKYVSVGSLVFVGAFCVEFFVFGQVGWLGITEVPLECYILVVIITLLAYIRHSANIGRLLKGTERKIGQKKD